MTFAAGLSLADIQFSWGQARWPAMSGLATDPQLPYTTLDLSWGQIRGIDVIMPRSGELIGSGIQEFVFADGSRYSLAQMIAMAPPAPSFDPAILYQLGMGAKRAARRREQPPIRRRRRIRQPAISMARREPINPIRPARRERVGEWFYPKRREHLQFN